LYKKKLVKMREKEEKWMRASLKSEKDVLYIDMDGVLCDFEKKFDELVKSGLKKHEIYASEGFFVSLEPLPGAIEAVLKLDKYYEVYFLSTAPWSNISAGKEKRVWIGTNFGNMAKKKLILTHNKGLQKGKYLIDDRIANGVADFEGEHIHFGTEKFPNWESILKYLIPA